MNANCFEIGTIQAFLDGETAPDLSLKVTNHVAACDSCARMLADAEEENSVVFSALDRELDALVPTQRLWNRINDSIAVEKSRTSIWTRLQQALRIFVANPSVTVAAGVLIVFGLFAAFWSLNRDVSNDVNGRMVAGPDNPQTPEQPNSPVITIATTDSSEALAPPATGPSGVIESNLPPKELRNLVANANYKNANNRSKAQRADLRTPVEAAPEFLPGEESYVKTIADLKQNVDSQKDTVLNPSSRVAYERDMAVVNDAIVKMKEVVRKNPKNQSAKQVLYSSYQNKIDLLNSVAAREELMASFQ